MIKGNPELLKFQPAFCCDGKLSNYSQKLKRTGAYLVLLLGGLDRGKNQRAIELAAVKIIPKAGKSTPQGFQWRRSP